MSTASAPHYFDTAPVIEAMRLRAVASVTKTVKNGARSYRRDRLPYILDAINMREARDGDEIISLLSHRIKCGVAAARDGKWYAPRTNELITLRQALLAERHARFVLHVAMQRTVGRAA